MIFHLENDHFRYKPSAEQVYVTWRCRKMSIQRNDLNHGIFNTWTCLLLPPQDILLFMCMKLCYECTETRGMRCIWNVAEPHDDIFIYRKAIVLLKSIHPKITLTFIPSTRMSIAPPFYYDSISFTHTFYCTIPLAHIKPHIKCTSIAISRRVAQMFFQLNG